MSSQLEFDMGSLIWVKGEIDQAIERARQSLQEYAEQADTAKLKFAQSHLHQATGAIEMVGLDGLARFAEALERYVAVLQQGDSGADATALSLVDKAASQLKHYLETISNGAPNIALKLAETYRDLLQASSETGSGADLFFPELSISLPALPTQQMPAEDQSKYLKAARSRFEAGLLKWLKNERQEAATFLAQALYGAMKLQTSSLQKGFWWSAGAVCESLNHAPAELDIDLRNLLSRINLQLRKLSESNAKVAERLFRDVLYVAAMLPSGSRQLQAVRQAYALHELMPGTSGDEASEMHLQLLARELRDVVNVCKENWARFSSGSADKLQPFQTHLQQLNDRVGELALEGLASLVGQLSNMSQQFGKSKLSENQTLEIATALLLIENALNNFPQHSSEFPEQAAVMCQRLQLGENAPDTPVSLLDEVSRQAQERLLVTQVSHEIQTNLRQIETVLDAFFRDQSTRPELNSLDASLRQIQGALMIMELDDANRLLSACETLIDRCKDEATQPETDDLENLAEGLSALGFYIDAIQRGDADPMQGLRPILVKLLGDQPAATIEAEEPAATIEAEVHEQKQQAESLIQELAQQPEAPEVKEALKATLTSLAENADLLNDSALAEQSATTLIQLEQDVPAPVAAPAAPEAVSDAAVDAELLEVYLEEAVEVLANIQQHIEIIAEQAHNKEALTVIRRGYHTLKGSGRMVGLNHLGEVAWAVEQVMNKWLQDEKGATPALISLLSLSHADFSRWVEELQTTGSASVEASRIFELTEQLKRGEEPAATETVEPAEVTAVENLQTEPVVEESLSIELPDEMEAVSVELTEVQPLELDLPLEIEPVAAAQASEIASTEPVFDLAIDTPEAPLEQTGEPVIDLAIDMPEIVINDDIQIGSVAISPVLFGIFTEEANKHVVTLKSELPALQRSGVVERTMVHAAHTLCGIANTTGFSMLGELGYALEQTLLAAEKHQQQLDASALDLVTGTVAAVAEMLVCIEQKSLPEHQPELVAKLQTLSDTLNQPQPLPSSLSAGDLVIQIDETGFSPDDTVAFNLDNLSIESQAPVTSSAPSFDLAIDTPESTDSAGPVELAEVELSLPDTVEQIVPVDEIAVTEVPDLSLEGDLELIVSDLPEPSEVEEVIDLAALIEPVDVMAVADAPSHDILEITDADTNLETTEASFSPEMVTLEGTDLHSEELVLPDAESETTLDIVPTEAVMSEEDAEHIDLSALVAEIDVTDAAEANLIDSLVAEEVALEQSIPDQNVETEDQLLEAINTDDNSDTAPELADTVESLETTDITEAVELTTPTESDNSQETDPAPLENVEATEVIDEETDLLSSLDTLAADLEIPVEALTEAEHLAAGVSGIASTEVRLAELQVADDIDEQLLPIFIEEAQELLPQLSSDLRQWRSEPEKTAFAEDLRRTLHTLKGSARMAGAMRLGEATHNMETRLINSGDHANEPLFEALEADYDLVTELYEQLQGGGKFANVAAADAGAESVQAGAAIAGPTAVAANVLLGVADPEQAKASIRVRSDLVDRLVNQAGEVSIARSRIESEMQALKQSLLDLTDNVTRLRGQLREIEIQAESQMQARTVKTSDHLQTFDPLEFDRFSRLQELTRFMAESVNDVATIQHNLLKNLDESTAALSQQGRMTKDLQQELMRVRMVPFSSISERLYRIVRQTSKEIGKKVNLELRGGRVEIDRSVLEKMTSPFEHMLRNAIDHGIEAPETRQSTGKPEFGDIQVEVRQEGNELVLILRDDGAGLNLARIRSKALEKGLITEDANLTDNQLMQLIFEPGFSTAAVVSQISGRGIGMDVVKNEISDLGGRVDVDSVEGKGTIFTIHLPLTLAVTQTVLVKVAGKTYAIPSVMVEQVQERKLPDLEKIYQDKEVVWQDNHYPFNYLPRLLGDFETMPEQKRYNTVLLLRSGLARMSLHVDALIKNQEVVVKNIGPQLARVPGMAGATVLGNGEIVMILNPLQLATWQTTVGSHINQQQSAQSNEAHIAEEALLTTPVVMVVDDSLTVRKITGRLLAREGYQVVTAKDGVDALQQLQDIQPAVMLVDIEMPRMDGFELTRNVRSDPATRQIPIIMITSRTADKHRNYAMELGVNVFLGKPYQEDELLDNIQQLINRSKEAALIAEEA